ncbi:hypothetical protein V2I01_41020 [Micromonospora sp. BRA006-A]|nr:hypothetical protein [Micromonospora sp. BRA006-A]
MGHVAVAAELRRRRRHQLQEITVHTYDAQLTVGAPRPLPVEVALDGVEDFLSTCCATTVPWPYEPAVLDYHLTEGRVVVRAALPRRRTGHPPSPRSRCGPGRHRRPVHRR